MRRAASGGRAQLGLQRPGQQRGRPLPRAPAPRGPSPPTPRRPQALPRQRAPCQASVPRQPPLPGVSAGRRSYFGAPGSGDVALWSAGSAEMGTRSGLIRDLAYPGARRESGLGSTPEPKPTRQGCPRVPRMPTSGEGKGRSGERFPWS